MAEKRVNGGSNMSFLMQKEGISPENIEAVLNSSSTSGRFQASSSMVNFKDNCTNTSNQVYYRLLDRGETGDKDLDDYLPHPDKKRWLAADQVQFLEKSFEIENKLDPVRKIKLAKELGLQPRQVAIWFQNRRARWKTRQLEKDYEILKADYDSLKVEYENLCKEKEKLQSEVTNLSNTLFFKENVKNTIKLENSAFPFPKSDPDSAIKMKSTDTPNFRFNHNLSSANSIVNNSDCPPLVDLVDSSNIFEPDQSDVSYTEEDEEVKGYRFLKLEDSLGQYVFPVEDHAFLFWPY